MTRTKWFHRGCQIVGWMLIAALVFNNIWYLTRPQVELWVVITNAVGLFLGLGLAMEIQYPGMLNRAGRLITGKYTSYAWECPEHGITAISDRRAQLDKKEEGNAND